MKRILLIEDNQDVRENTAEILALANYEVITAMNGKDGVESALATTPDLIICDIMMPVLDGYGVLHLLSKNTSTSLIPFIFLSAKAEKTEIRKGMEMGADDYLTKPFDDIELLNAIESRLKKTEILHKEFPSKTHGVNEMLSKLKGIEEMPSLQDGRDVKTWKKKEHIYSEGEFPKGVYLILDGKVKVSRSNEQGKELITGLYKKDDFLGHLAILEQQRYLDSASVLEDTTTCFISREDFMTLIFENKDISRRFIKMISNSLLDKEEQLLKIAYNSVRKKVADALVSLYSLYNKDEQTVFSIAREDLANLTGTATETTIRTLSDFRDEGLIEIKAGKITILQAEKLTSLRN